MANVIRNFRYKTAGRGRGVLGLKHLQPLRRPGEKGAAAENVAGPEIGEKTAARPSPECSSATETAMKTTRTSVVVLYNYTANPESPGGFKELTVQSGQILEFLGEVEDNEHWWRVRNEDGEDGCVPASYVIKKEEQALPWLQLAALQNEETERKERVKRLQMQKDAAEGKGYGPPPKVVAKPYVSAYNKSGSIAAPGGKQYYCEVCEKQLNGPKPYQAHLASKTHREELALQEDY